MKVIWNGREVEISPKIVELLKKRGWTWPFSEEVKRERIEASKRFVPMSTPPEILEEMAKDDHVLYRILQIKKEQVRKEREKAESCEGGRGAQDIS